MTAMKSSLRASNTRVDSSFISAGTIQQAEKDFSATIAKGDVESVHKLYAQIRSETAPPTKPRAGQ
jgi:hypothetical protein